ncbi:MAG: DsbA family protein [Patescibacteria group bacterium]
MKNIPLLIGTLVGTLALVFGIAFFFGRAETPESVDPTKFRTGTNHVLSAEQTSFSDMATPSATPEASSSDNQASPSAEKKIVTVVEFSDLQCPACKIAAPIRDQIRAAHPGQVEFVFHYYPLTQIHANALLAAQAVEAASKFNEFWQYHDVLFEKQEEWAELSSNQAKEKLIQYAVDLKIDKDGFTQELNSVTVKSAVQSDINLGNEINISATPTFFVDGKQVSAPDVAKTVSDILGS